MATRNKDEFKGRLEFDERANLIEITLDDHEDHERLAQILRDNDTSPGISITLGPIPPPPPPPPQEPCRFAVNVKVTGRARRGGPVREPVIRGGGDIRM
jgi:hypothetical protein